MKKHFFITGTDTGVGKTHVTAALLEEYRRQGLRAAAFKPIACGSGGRDDARIFAQIMGPELPLEILNPIYLRHPLAPSVAARLDRKKIDLDKIFSTYEKLRAAYDVLLVEGAGGLMVPIRDDYFMADLARKMKLPLIIVSRLGLGAINHSLLTVQQSRIRRLPIAGLVLNDVLGGRRGLAERTNIEVIPHLCGVPLLGVMPHGTRRASAVARQICQKL